MAIQEIKTTGEALKYLTDDLNITYEELTQALAILNNGSSRQYTPLDFANMIFSNIAKGGSITKILDDIQGLKDVRIENIKEDLEKESIVHRLEKFKETIIANKNATAIRTGYKSVDEILDGGLYAGLYVVGAISSLGKTTFCLQMADKIAASGKDVMIISLEMDSNELIAKSVSRLTLFNSYEKQNDDKLAMTTRGILDGKRWQNYTAQQAQNIQDAITEYGNKIAGHLYIHQGIGNIGVEQIRQLTGRFIEAEKEAPVIIIDYLQILAPTNEKATDKQNADKAILELKRISRDFNTPVICISSFNRDNYTAPLNMTAFKESGAIEYSSDVLIGLQYNEMDYQPDESQKDHDKRVRQLISNQAEIARQGKAQKIQLKILKNRNGNKGDTILNFIPKYNTFTDTNR